MRFIDTLARMAGWLCFKTYLFCVELAKFRSARRHFEDQITGRVTFTRRNDDGVRPEIAYFDEVTGGPFELSLKKTS